MKNIFKTAVMAIAMVMISLGSSAQARKGDVYLGGNLAVGVSKSVQNPGIGAKLTYNVTDHLRLAGSSTWFMPMEYGKGNPKAKLGMWDYFSADVHWLIPVWKGNFNRALSIYPLVGGGAMNFTQEVKASCDKSSATDFGFNAGGGMDWTVSSCVILNGEAKYLLRGKRDRIVLSLGVMFKL